MLLFPTHGSAPCSVHATVPCSYGSLLTSILMSALLHPRLLAHGSAPCSVHATVPCSYGSLLTSILLSALLHPRLLAHDSACGLFCLWPVDSPFSLPCCGNASCLQLGSACGHSFSLLVWLALPLATLTCLAAWFPCCRDPACGS
ncbi:hypothetical protein O6H91_11G002800 [Diphasiastrum complanatum]|uniref:Uncharacterized protein n=1 Tax=Diphasiastrum complanatum TaxID=34168 RepID=A0ACC2C5Q6_DIPCM|nr:hypothetical protein O6H91_11G002800 [Diphasiastrum complanatum]